ncbi:MAG TPA: group II intron reverse transcriptase/maturase [Stenomitos sp.]
MNLWNGTKSVPISRQMVWAAYKKVRSHGKSAGVDAVSMEEFDSKRSQYLYKLWNRLASGSYYPPAVKEVEIPKKDGKMRKLGIPTISDRIAQKVIKDYLEPRLEEIFSPNSYGYRPNKNAHQAVSSVRENCRKNDWVIDLDIKGFFDNIDHERLTLATEKHVPEKWVKMYIKRWLNMPIQKKTGEIVAKQGKGTPQGGVISPLLANLFLHYVLDKWLEKTDATISYARYADDAIIHCKTKSQAEMTLQRINERMKQCGLELNPEKTKLVYCSDYRRKDKQPSVKFDFLGFTFQPRRAMSKKTGRLFLGYDCAISISSGKRIADKLEELRITNSSFDSIVGIAQYLNPYIRGWVNYYGKFRANELSKVFRLLKHRLVRWVRLRYKRYKMSINKAYEWINRIRIQYPNLFYHWQLGFSH